MNAGASNAAAKISAVVARDAGLRLSENCAMTCPVRCASVMRLHNQLHRGFTVPLTELRRGVCQPYRLSRLRDGTFPARPSWPPRIVRFISDPGWIARVTLVSLGTILVIL